MGEMILLLMGHCSVSHVAYGTSYVRYRFLRHTLCSYDGFMTIVICICRFVTLLDFIFPPETSGIL